ncbi:MAG: hypothetical protein M3256_10325 [Actinomycetota bacterium]|nr:hypothetical protein [Actinomycetota bacterium]
MRCLLCSVDVGAQPDERSDEHVLGKWVSRRTGNPMMWIAEKKRYYGAIRLPCCKRCNGGPMREMESSLSEAFDAQDLGALSAVQGRIWGAWVSKVAYGLLVSELSSRNVDVDGRVVLPERLNCMRQFALTYRNLFRAYLKAESVPDGVLSVVPFRTQFDRNQGDVTVFQSDELIGTLVIQILGVAVFVSARDAGYCGGLNSPYTEAARTLELNPIQLIEVYCRYVDHMNSRVAAREAHAVETRDGLEIRCLGTNLPGPPVRGFLASRLREKLAPLGFAPGDVLDPPQTWLLDSEGHARHLPLEATRGKSPHRK